MKTVVDNIHEEEHEAIDISRFDLSTVVGRKVTIYSKQFKGKPLESRVIVAGNNTITIDRSGAAGLVDSLVHNQQVTVNLEYRGEQISIVGTLKRTGTSGCKIIFDDKVVPLSRRRFPRVYVSRPVRLAALPSQSISPKGLSRLRWMATSTINLSGGGTLIRFSSYLEPPTYLCMSIDLTEIPFPRLVVGQVRHCASLGSGSGYHIGIKFIPREERVKHLSNGSIRSLPMSVFEYDEVQRCLLSKRLLTWIENNKEKETRM